MPYGKAELVPVPFIPALGHYPYAVKPSRLEVQQWIIFDNIKLSHGLLDSGKAVPKTVTTTWSAGSLRSANVIIHATGVTFVEARLLVNGVEVGRSMFNVNPVWDTTIDISSIIVNGPNQFIFETLKNPGIGWGDVRATVILAFDADETHVVVPPTMPDWLIPAAIGAIIVAMAVVLARRR